MPTIVGFQFKLYSSRKRYSRKYACIRENALLQVSQCHLWSCYTGISLCFIPRSNAVISRICAGGLFYRRSFTLHCPYNNFRLQVCCLRLVTPVYRKFEVKSILPVEWFVVHTRKRELLTRIFIVIQKCSLCHELLTRTLIWLTVSFSYSRNRTFLFLRYLLLHQRSLKLTAVCLEMIIAEL